MCLSAFHGPHCNYLKQRAYNDQMIWNHMKTFTAEPRTKQIKMKFCFMNKRKSKHKDKGEKWSKRAKKWTLLALLETLHLKAGTFISEIFQCVNNRLAVLYRKRVYQERKKNQQIPRQAEKNQQPELVIIIISSTHY